MWSRTQVALRYLTDYRMRNGPWFVVDLVSRYLHETSRNHAKSSDRPVISRSFGPISRDLGIARKRAARAFGRCPNLAKSGRRSATSVRAEATRRAARRHAYCFQTEQPNLPASGSYLRVRVSRRPFCVLAESGFGFGRVSGGLGRFF